MTKSKKLKPIADYNHSLERDAAKVLAISQNNLDSALRRLNELVLYRQEYAKRFKQICNSGASVARMQDFRSFLEKLEQAAAQQRTKVDIARLEHERNKSVWLGKRSRRKALDKVIERYCAQETKREIQREQNELDEFSSRRASTPPQGED